MARGYTVALLTAEDAQIIRSRWGGRNETAVWNTADMRVMEDHEKRRALREAGAPEVEFHPARRCEGAGCQCERSGECPLEL